MASFIHKEQATVKNSTWGFDCHAFDMYCTICAWMWLKLQYVNVHTKILGY